MTLEEQQEQIEYLQQQTQVMRESHGHHLRLQSKSDRAFLATLKDMQAEVDSLQNQLAYIRAAQNAMLDMLHMLAIDNGVMTQEGYDDLKATMTQQVQDHEGV